ncbi:MAG: FKBP-type peptidyl-prolyl cis-trans isomerase [Gammaproteobacteria bacterium]|jgi:FKBP-type peptidyl-prolyl cis-trans isomerase|nr:FKBP-type peptidyl-prolyl cis-trans isomerase [Gammaproteobacteria bacterium]
MKRTTGRLLLSALAASMLLCAAALAAEPFRSGPGGIRYQDLQSGQGDAALTGQVATIHFVAWIDENGARGREVYNSRSRGQPVSFVIGTDGVMPGWNAGVVGMKPGGKRLLLLPPAMAYGARAIEDAVPANAAMMFRIELIRLENPPGS